MLLFTKRSFLALALLLMAISTASAQKRPLTKSRQSSYYTYIYKLSPAEVLKFYQFPDKDLDEKMLKNPLDSFRTDGIWENKLATGNYLKVWVEQNKLKYSLIENHSAYLKMFANKYENRFTLINRAGSYITTASVLLNGKEVKYDDKSATWYFKHGKKANIMQVDFAGVSNFFSILPERDYSYARSKNNLFTALWASVKGIFSHPYQYPSQRYKGFMVFNKPIYKPGDTVKFKSFILDGRTKRPVSQKKLLVKLAGDYDEKKTIGTVNSYRDGGFEYSFVLNDSLDLDLDESYNILLADPAKEPKEASDDDKDHGDDNAMWSGRFRYEEYELKSINFAIRADKKEHWPGNSQAIYLKATDENDLPVIDGRVTMTVLTNQVTERKTNHLFVPDTLWTHKFPLDAIGETKIVIPDSIFPKANISYNVNARFLNANNEEQTNWVSATFKHQLFKIVTDIVADSIKLNYQHLGKIYNASATVSGTSKAGDTVLNKKVSLPGFITINPNVSNYTIETDSTATDIDMQDFDSNVSLTGDRTPDSIFVSVANPRKLHFFYSVFAAGKLIDAGSANRLYYAKAYRHDKPVSFRVNYIWAGEVKTEDISLSQRKDWLTMNIIQPASVYPGQKVKTDILVTDAAGKPVVNADLTAWSITKKFNADAPQIPFLGKRYRYVKPKKEYKLNEADIAGTSALNWVRWSREIGLDSITYYQFTHPDNVYRIEEPGVDTITQIAPFVVQRGDIVPVHILYIDGVPAYFSQAKQLQPYSFKVSPGFHTLALRTANHNIRMDSVWVEQSRKLIISVNADKHPSEKMTDTLSFAEATRINKYLVSVVNNFDGKKSIISQPDRIFLFNPYSAVGSTILTGPLSPNYTIFQRDGDKPLPFIAEPDYFYWFEPGLIKQKSTAKSYPFNRALATVTGTTDYKQYVLTNSAADSIWQEHLDTRSNTVQLFKNPPVAGNENGKLLIQRDISNLKKPVLIKNIILYKYNDPDFIRVYPGNTTDFSMLEKGLYRLFFLLKGDSYDIKEKIEIKAHGVNFYDMAVTQVYPRDSASIRISQIISNRKSQIYRNGDNEIENDALKLKEAFNEKYFNSGDFSQSVVGRVIGSDDKLPVVGATIRIKGTKFGTQTDVNGMFKLSVPPQGKLIANYLGYLPQEIDFIAGISVNITLKESSNQLNEVVVVGYGSVRKKDLTGSITIVTPNEYLQGRAAGVTIITEGEPGAGPTIMVRGLSSAPGKMPLYVVDGVVVTDLKGLDPNMINDIKVLKDAGATAIYGARAANGVILVSTKRKSDNIPAPPDPSQSPNPQTLRKNFSDYAYWQPKLTTDANGKASFTSVMPDDITSWRTFVVGITGNRQTGIAEGQMKSFKPLSANFVSPQFAVAGDEISVIGKVMNYTPGAAKLTRTFAYNGKLLKQDALDITNAKIDTMNITAEGIDSLTFEYSIKRDNGYFDGEKRMIPVVKQGVEETKGMFAALNGDTTVTFQFDPALGAVIFRAEASALPVLAEEAKHLRDYKYLCNEQLASKLKGLLTEKRISTYLGEPFKFDKNIREVIKKLQESRQSTGTWGWWKDSDTELWISLHAVEALTNATALGYQTQIDAKRLTDYLVFQMESYRGAEKLACLELLSQLKAKVDYNKYIALVAKDLQADKNTPAYDRLRLMLLRQKTANTIKTDSLLSIRRTTLFGNAYWGEESYRFFDNSIQLSILAYKILKAEGKHPELLQKIRGYFLEQRKSGEWRNTYESAQILETILPDILGEGKQVKRASITINGGTNQSITQFPYTATLKDKQIRISKTGTLPVYVTGYQQFWNSKPEKVSKDFTVNTSFERKGDKLTKLKGGEAVVLKAEVTAKGDGDYVMINIPIPAGCSYDSKEQAYANNEVHREYFKDRVSIFCRKLKQGSYTFTINLMPRYNGVYTLNPAKAELMYFPVFYGREGLRKVRIGE